MSLPEGHCKLIDRFETHDGSPSDNEKEAWGDDLECVSCESFGVNIHSLGGPGTSSEYKFPNLSTEFLQSTYQHQLKSPFS
jgi:hypothetical protein